MQGSAPSLPAPAKTANERWGADSQAGLGKARGAPGFCPLPSRLGSFPAAPGVNEGCVFLKRAHDSED